MTDNFTKQAVRTALGLQRDAALAEFFGVSRAAVSQWDEAEPIPERQQLKLLRKRPDVYKQLELGTPERPVAHVS